MKKLKISAISILLFVFLIGCGKRFSKSYIDDQKKMLYAFNIENFDVALSLADKAVTRINKKTPQDTFVALLERATCALAAGRYDIAIKDFQKAEGRFLDIEGTISISEEGSSLFLDNTTKEYEAEPLEKIMLSPYLALAYWGKGDFNGARIERNRSINKINQYIETKGNSSYLENPFARYLSAIIYENEGKFQDAKIEYRKIKKVRKFTTGMMNEHLNILKKGRPKLSDLVIFVGIGKSPVKHEKKYRGRGSNSRGKSIRVDITYAVFKARMYLAKKCRVLINGESVGETKLLYNLSETILAQYKKNKPKLIKSLVARAILKVGTQAVGNALSKRKGVVGAAGAALSLFSKASSALERADLRSWITLPAEIQALRLRALPKGKHTLQLVYLGRGGAEIARSKVKNIMIRDGEISVAHFRVVK